MRVRSPAVGIEVRPLTPPDRQEAVACLAAAFHDDPVFNWLTGHPADPLARLRHVYGAFVDSELRKAVHHTLAAVDVHGALVGVAIWHAVDDWRLPLREVARSTPAMIRGFGRHIPRALAALSRVEKVHPREPHWYLAHVGVNPEYQGRGVGGLLVRAGLERAGADGVGAYLENSKPRNTPFYARHGFAEGDHIAVGDGAPPVLAMWRAAR